MRNPAASSANFTLTQKQRAILAAALVALGPAVWPVRAQADLAAVRTRAEQGDPEALNSLANAFANGQGVAQNLPEAIRLYQLAADRGLAPAQFNLGMMHELGRGVKADIATAFKFYLKAAEQGFAPAQFNVGNMYANGIGIKPDYFEAALWFRQAADRSVPEAQYNLALAYELGRGVAKDEASAQKWYRGASNQGYARARYNLALMLEEGRGSAADPAAALELYRAAALQNYAPAQNNLGILLAEGRGAPADLSQAYAWLSLAVENGAKPTGRDIVAQQFTSSQLAEANVAVAKLRAQLGAREGAGAAPAGPVLAASAPATAPGRPSASAAGDAADLNARLSATASDLANLTTEHARLSAAAQALSRDKATLEQRLAAVEASRSDLSARAAAASEAATRVAQAEAARSKLAQDLAALQTALAETRATATRLAEENQRLKTSAAPAATAPSAEVATLTAKLEKAQDAINDARAEHARLAAAVETAQRDRANADQRLAASAQVLERERAALQQRVATAEAAARTAAGKAAAGPAKSANDPAADALRAQVEKLTRDSATLRAENDRAQGQIADLAGQLKTARASTASAAPAANPPGAAAPSPGDDARVAKLIADNSRLNDEVRRSTIQLSTLNRQLRTAQEKQGKSGDAAPATATPNADEPKLADLARQLEELRDANQKLTEENRRLAATPKPTAPAADTARLTADLATAQSDLNAFRAAAARAQQNLLEATNARETLAAEKAQLEKRLASAMAAAAPKTDPAALTKLRDDLGRTQSELAAARRTVEETQRELGAAQSAGSTKAAQLATELEQARQALAAATAVPRPDPARLSTLQKDLAAAQQTLTAEREAQKKLQARFDEANRALGQRSQADRELVEARKQLADLQTKFSAAQETGGADRTALAAARAQLEQAVRALEQNPKAAADFATVKEALAAATDNARRLEQANAALMQRADALAAQNQQLAAATDSATQAGAEVVKLKADLASAQKARAADREAQAKLQARLEAADQALAQRGGTERELVTARTELADLQTKLAAAQKTRAGGTESLAAMRAQLSDTQAKLTAAQQAQAAGQDAATQLAALTTRHEALTVERDRLAAAQRAQMGDKETLEKLNAQFDNASRTIVELTQRNDSLQKDLEVSKQSVAAALAAQAAAIKAAPTDAMRLEMQTLQDQVRTLETQLDEDRKNAAREMSSMASQLQRAREASKSLSEANRTLLAAKGSEDAAAKTELDQAAARLRATDEANEKLRAEQARLTAVNEQLALDKSSAERALVEMRKSAAGPAQERDSLRSQVEDMFIKLSNAERQLNQFKQASEVARTESEKARADFAALQARYAEAAKAGEQQSTSVAELTGLNEKLSTEKAALEKQFAQSRAASEQTRTELAELRTRLAAGDQALERQVASANETAAAGEKLQAQIKDLTTQLAAVRGENSRLGSVGEAAAALRNELAGTKTKLAEVTKAAATHGASVAELTGLNEKLALDKSALEQQVAQSRTSSEQTRTELAELRARVSAGDQALQRQVASFNDAALASEKLHVQLKDLSGQVTTLREENSRLGSVGEAATALRSELAGVKSKLAEVTKAAEAHGAGVAELTGQNEKIAAEKTALQQQFDQARTAAEQMRAELADLRTRVTAGNRAMDQQVASFNEVAAASEKLQSQVKDLTAQLTSVRAENSRLGGVGEAATALRTELADMKAKLAEAQKSAEQQGVTVAELTGANEKVSGSLKDLQEQLGALRADNARLAQEGEQGKQEAERKTAGVSATAAAQLTAMQRELATQRAENARLADSLQAVERDRVSRLAALQQENAAIAARLRQAQGTLDQIASAARQINGGPAASSSSNASSTPTISAQPAPVAPPPRTHVVQEGDSLTRISSRYYGTTQRWQEIYDANREVLKGENALRPGQRLKIP